MARLALQAVVEQPHSGLCQHHLSGGYASPPIRKTRGGDDIMAACGQLKSDTERQRKSKRQIEEEAGLR